MKKHWNTRRLVPVALLLTLILTCGAVFAYMFTRAPTQGVQFIPAKVSCEVYSTGTDEITGVTVKNTGNISAYLRVRLVTYWVDEHGNVAPKTSPTLEISCNDAWIEGSENTFYYKTPVDPGVVTPEFVLTPPIELQVSVEGYKQAVDIFGEAIQANPTTAVTESWGVTVSSPGAKITGVP